MVAAWRGPMGRDVPPITVSQHDRRHYREKVRQCLNALAMMLRESWFETEGQQVGLEVELHLVDESGAPSMRSPDVLDAIGDPHWAAELGRFNVEINVPPRPLATDVLDQLEGHLLASLKHADQRAADAGSRLGHDRHPAQPAAGRRQRGRDVGQSALPAAQRADLRGPGGGCAD